MIVIICLKLSLSLCACYCTQLCVHIYTSHCTSVSIFVSFCKWVIRCFQPFCARNAQYFFLFLNAHLNIQVIHFLHILACVRPSTDCVASIFLLFTSGRIPYSIGRVIWHFSHLCAALAGCSPSSSTALGRVTYKLEHFYLLYFIIASPSRLQNLVCVFLSEMSAAAKVLEVSHVLCFFFFFRFFFSTLLHVFVNYLSQDNVHFFRLSLWASADSLFSFVCIFILFI